MDGRPSEMRNCQRLDPCQDNGRFASVKQNATKISASENEMANFDRGSVSVIRGVTSEPKSRTTNNPGPRTAGSLIRA